jgi:hypothetical protein
MSIREHGVRPGMTPDAINGNLAARASIIARQTPKESR